jgi:FkbM family methyltransferase
MLRYPYGKQKILDSLQRALDHVEKNWPMTGSYERVDPYIIPLIRGDAYFEFIVYHIESKLWFDNFQSDFIMSSLAKKSTIAPDDVIFDLGANSGVVSLLMAKLCAEGGHVHAFDPYPWNAIATEHNAKLNYLTNVTVYPVGVSNRNYEISVSPNDSRIYVGSEQPDAQVLKVVAIRNFMHLRPTFLKIDIEGSEHDIFDGQSAETYASVRAFVLEFHPFWLRPRGIDPKTSLRGIEASGFTLHYHSVDYPEYDVDQYSDNHHLFWGKRAALAAEPSTEALVLPRRQCDI